MSINPPPLFDAVVRIDHIPVAGRALEISLDELVRATLAEQLKLSALDAFSAKLRIMPLRGGIRVNGRLVADIVQPSVVTLDPVHQHIDEPVDRVFLLTGQSDRSFPRAETFIDLEDDDFPDHIDGPEVDLSALLTEILVLAIDPYPRRPDENLDSIRHVLGDEPSGPFSVLKKFRKTGDG